MFIISVHEKCIFVFSLLKTFYAFRGEMGKQCKDLQIAVFFCLILLT